MQVSVFLFIVGLLAAHAPANGVRTGRLAAGGDSELSLVQSGLRTRAHLSAGGANSSGVHSSCFQPADTGSKSPEIKKVKVSGSTTEKAVEACLDLCRKEPDCTHYVLNNGSRICYLKRGSPQWYHYTGDLTATRFCSLPKTDECYRPTNIGSKTPDIKMKVIKADSAQKAMLECQFFCLSEKDCTHFTYSTRSHNCHIKAGKPQWYDMEQDMSATRTCNFGRVEKDCLFTHNRGSKTRELVPPVKVDKGQPEASVEECHRLCQVTENCSHMTYNVKSKKCFLKAGNPEWYDFPGDVSATRTCALFFEHGCYNSSNLGSRTKSIARKQIDSGSPEKSIKECQDACRSMPACTHFTYNKKSHTCYMKNGERDLVTVDGDVTATRECEWPGVF